MDSRLLSLILLLHFPGSLTLDNVSVTCYKICALKETQVTLKCSYSNMNIKTVFWFSQKQSTNWRYKDEPEDLTVDSDYSGRVKHQITNTNTHSTLIISDLRERDSGEYHLMFIMKDGVKHLSSSAVNLTVTDLQLRMNPESAEQRDQTVKLTCESSCTLTSTYYHTYWKKNGRYLKHTLSKSMLVTFRNNADSYSCSVDQDFTYSSSSVCISKSMCWNVTYTSTRVCALVGSTVDIPSSYSHPAGYTVIQAFWYYVRPGDLLDLHEEPGFVGRVEYLGNTLRIKDVKISDSGEYRFRIITNITNGKYSGSPGVNLTVTDTQVTSSPATVSMEETIILSCSTKCTLNNNHIYIWYKNGQQVTDGVTKLNKLYLDSVSREELQEYSCASVQGPEESTLLQNTAVILSVFLNLALIGALIGVLWYRRRRCTLSKNHREANEDVLYESVHHGTTSSDLMLKVDSDNQDIHYSSIHFRHSKTKHTSSVSTAVCPADTSDGDAVHYATVTFS
ncbi:uncharacterized protein LOC127641514 [Xyrauchen texanus]|uniref:uncharacterized protein LOC127641514 n=1 Tax=Xyrauchen texanus TaxID=154827 RepID=UPI0022422A8E|nr:uncharacterized protein LOC127641514 [Xyrauchen texanus]